jgi:hypothetical protein
MKECLLSLTEVCELLREDTTETILLDRVALRIDADKLGLFCADRTIHFDFDLLSSSNKPVVHESVVRYKRNLTIDAISLDFRMGAIVENLVERL